MPTTQPTSAPSARLLSFDFADSVQASKYPMHGWALNSQQLRLLWMPIVRLLSDAQLIRESKGLTNALTREDVHRLAAFYPTFRSLLVALRELHRVMVQQQRLPAELPYADQDLQTWHATQELLILHLESVFVYLRRLADRFAGAIRILLFADDGKASSQMKHLRRSILDEHSLHRYRPICDTTKLQDAFANHCTWFDELRSDETSVGIRDRMEHHATQTLIGGHRANDEPLVHTAYLTLPAGGIETNRELFGTLRWMLADLCEFFAGIHGAVDYGPGYSKADCVVLFGEEGDVTGWWPKI